MEPFSTQLTSLPSRPLDVNFFSGATTPEATGELTDIEKKGLQRLQDFKCVI